MGGRQRVTGIVVNEKLSVPREEVRRLHAILHQAKLTGLAAQNRENRPDFEAWLHGKIAYVCMVDRPKDLKLLEAFEALRSGQRASAGSWTPSPGATLEVHAMGHPTLENETPFAFDMMGLADEEGQPLLLLVVKATYSLGATGLTLANEQVPVKWGGEPWGKPGESSDKYEPEAAFIKPATDVVLIGHAYAPQKGATEGLVALLVGPLKKAVRVVGERTWFRSMGRVSATKPLPFDTLPLTWERAFGGWDRTDAAKPTFEPRNPVGTGFRASPRHFEEGLRLPNLEDPAEPLRELGQKVTPVGFGFTSPHWQPRAKYAGTYDEAWNKTRKPLLPKDFDRRFFNAAAPGLVAPGYLKGEEPVIIAGASPKGRLSFSLPGQPAPVVTVELTTGEDATPPMHLDTVILDTDAEQVLLLWRGHVVLGEGLHDVRGLHVTAEGVAPRKT